MDRQAMAMVHSITGGRRFLHYVWSFASRADADWSRWTSISDVKLTPAGAAIVACLPVVVVGQYVLGGMLRHLHVMLNEHIVGAIVTGFAASSAIFVLLRTEHPLLRLCGVLIASSLLAQVSLGVGAYITDSAWPQLVTLRRLGRLFNRLYARCIQ